MVPVCVSSTDNMLWKLGRSAAADVNSIRGGEQRPSLCFPRCSSSTRSAAFHNAASVWQQRRQLPPASGSSTCHYGGRSRLGSLCLVTFYSVLSQTGVWIMQTGGKPLNKSARLLSDYLLFDLDMKSPPVQHGCAVNFERRGTLPYFQHSWFCNHGDETLSDHSLDSIQ